MKISRTNVSDEKDTRKKVAAMRSRASNDAAFAVLAAQRIAEQPALLDGLGKVVEGIARHDAAAAILHDVFEKGAADKYPAAYRAFLSARFFDR